MESYTHRRLNVNIQVIDCKYLFIDSMIEEIKNDIINYHQGFMVVNDKLYLPLYQVLQRKYILPKPYETTIIDLDDIDRFDCLATYFYKVNALDIDDVIDLYNDWLDDEFETVLNTADEIAEANYQQGFTQGYNEGDEDGYNKCYCFNKVN